MAETWDINEIPHTRCCQSYMQFDAPVVVT